MNPIIEDLQSALNAVALVPGASYSCEVHGLPVRVEVGSTIDADTMYDPWIDLPRPSPIRKVPLRIVERMLPDPPPFARAGVEV